MTTDSRSIQIWPRGESIRFSGEYPHYTVDGLPATEDQTRQIRIQELAEIYRNRDIWHCDSYLVDMLLQRGDVDGFSYDEIENVYASPEEWTVKECRDYIMDVGSDSDCPDPNPWTMDREELTELLQSVSINVNDDETDDTLRAAVISNMDDETIDGIDEWRDAARELAQDNPAEIYEWWRCDPWLIAQLRGIGECVLDNDYGAWWGRTCTGQSLIMDGTLQRIAANFVRE